MTELAWVLGAHDLAFSRGTMMSTVSPSAKQASLRVCSAMAFGFYSPPPLLSLRLLGHPFVCFWIMEYLEISGEEDSRLLRTEKVCLSSLACFN